MRSSNNTHLFKVKWIKPLILLGAAITIFLRQPAFFLEPRFWAEEGTSYFSHAYNNSWYSSLLTPHHGYYSLFNNVIAIIASKCVDLAHAPLVTTLSAFVVQLIPIIIIILSNAEIWNNVTSKILGVAIIIFTPLSGELWLNTINSQFYLCLATFLILLEPTDESGHYKRIFFRILLAISGLTGVVSCFLTPFYIIRAWYQRERENIIQAAILLICSAVQFVVLIFLVSKYLAATTARTSNIGFQHLVSVIWTKNIILPLLGINFADRFGAACRDLMGANMQNRTWLSIGLFLILAALLWFITMHIEKKVRIIMIGSFLLIDVISILASDGDKNYLLGAVFGQRYFYVPTSILLFMYLINLKESIKKKKILSLMLSGILLLLCSITGITTFSFKIQENTLFYNKNWPKWENEASVWAADPNHIMKIWPPTWFLKIMKPAGATDNVKTAISPAINTLLNYKIPGLIEALRNGNVLECYDAAVDLTKIGPGAVEAVPDLIDLLKDDNGAIQLQAAFALSSIRFGKYTKQAVPILVATIEDKQRIVRVYAANLLADIGPDTSEAVPALTKIVAEEASSTIGWLAADALGQIGADARSALPVLRSAMQKQAGPVGTVYIKDAIDKIEKAK